MVIEVSSANVQVNLLSPSSLPCLDRLPRLEVAFFLRLVRVEDKACRRSRLRSLGAWLPLHRMYKSLLKLLARPMELALRMRHRVVGELTLFYRRP